MNPERFVVALVASTGNGELIGRIRLQKITYLLQHLGNDGAGAFSFYYHHYGPYSRDLDSALLDAEFDDFVEEVRRHRQSDGAAYSVFRLGRDVTKKDFLLKEPFRSWVQDLSQENVTVLELAATAHWLSEVEKVENWKKEIKRRKGWKTKEGRLEKAETLLNKLNLPPVADGVRE